MDKRAGYAMLMDATLKTINSLYTNTFKEHNIQITPEQWVILEKINDLGEDASQQEITALSYRNKATTSRMIDALVNKGLVERTRFSGDQKRYRLVITHDGRKLVNLVSPIVTKLRDRGYQSIPEGDFDTFMSVLKSLQENYMK